MSTVIDRKGLLEIPDPEGELHSYSVRAAPPSAALWSCELVRLDTQAHYHVELVAPGRWRCTCEAFKYRKRGVHACKHIESLTPLYLVLDALAPQGAPP